MAQPHDLFDDLPVTLSQELFQTILSTPNVKVERIVSFGHASPEGFWYDQPRGEWVLVLRGAARVRFEGQPPVELLSGSYLDIPAHQRHRVDWTDPAQPTVWLAVHY